LNRPWDNASLKPAAISNSDGARALAIFLIVSQEERTIEMLSRGMRKDLFMVMNFMMVNEKS
jgi:hypothetical protein